LPVVLPLLARVPLKSASREGEDGESVGSVGKRKRGILKSAGRAAERDGSFIETPK